MKLTSAINTAQNLLTSKMFAWKQKVPSKRVCN